MRLRTQDLRDVVRMHDAYSQADNAIYIYRGTLLAYLSDSALFSVATNFSPSEWPRLISVNIDDARELLEMNPGDEMEMMVLWDGPAMISAPVGVEFTGPGIRHVARVNGRKLIALMRPSLTRNHTVYDVPVNALRDALEIVAHHVMLFPKGLRVRLAYSDDALILMSYMAHPGPDDDLYAAVEIPLVHDGTKSIDDMLHYGFWKTIELPFTTAAILDIINMASKETVKVTIYEHDIDVEVSRHAIAFWGLGGSELRCGKTHDHDDAAVVTIAYPSVPSAGALSSSSDNQIHLSRTSASIRSVARDADKSLSLDWSAKCEGSDEGASSETRIDARQTSILLSLLRDSRRADFKWPRDGSETMRVTIARRHVDVDLRLRRLSDQTS